MNGIVFSLIFCLLAGGCAGRTPASTARTTANPRLVPIGAGWARSSVNAVIFRKDAVTTHGDVQYAAYYDADGRVVLARRRLGSTAWETHVTPYTGNVEDAHNAISIAVDGSGVLHMAWDHHGHALRYARGTAPGALTLTEQAGMTGRHEDRVTYPQFYNLAGGDLLFVYRQGGSGDGNVHLNRYDVRTQTWSSLQAPLIDGQGQRNAYVNQLAIDSRGVWHLSWCWRESPDVATNHDIGYAWSADEGRTWQTSGGEAYTLPITAATAEYIRRIPQGSELINQTSMAVDGQDRPMVATYWRPDGTDVPQYHLVWYDGQRWQTTQVGHRTTAFQLSGGGTRRIPISRPQVVASGQAVYLIFRAFERGGGVSVAVSEDALRSTWRILDLTTEPVGLWEPTYDTALWQREGRLHLFHQRVGQGEGETLEDVPPQQVSILEWDP